MQILAAFAIGGGLITLLGVLAEKSPRALRGVIIAFPSTMLVSFLFIAYEHSAEAIATLLPKVYYSLIGSAVFSICYAKLALCLKNLQLGALLKVVIVLLLASLFWLAFPLSSTVVSLDTSQALIVLLLSLAALQIVFSLHARSFPVCAQPPTISRQSIVFRALFAGGVVSVAVAASTHLGPFWGAMVGGTYPASFGSQLAIFHYKYPAKYLPSLIKTIPIGILSTTVYSSVAAYSFPRLGLLAGTLVSLGASIIASIAVGIISRRYLR